MLHPESGKFLAGLDNALAAVAALGEKQATDLEASWQVAVNVLSWLYRCDHAEQKTGQDAYLADREASPHGRTLAALVWLRGKIEHEQYPAPAFEMSPKTMYVRRDGVWEPVEAFVRADQEWRATDNGAQHMLVWPTLPASMTDPYHRHEWYAARAAGLVWTIPLDAAAKFLRERGASLEDPKQSGS